MQIKTIVIYALVPILYTKMFAFQLLHEVGKLRLLRLPFWARDLKFLSRLAWMGCLCVFLGANAKALDGQIEVGAVWVSRNDVRIPGDGGTMLDLRELTGSGPSAYGRLHAIRRFGERHELRLTLAPFQVSGKGRLQREVVFDSQTFPSGRLTRGVYRFNTYRLTYRYTLLESDRQRWGIGAAVLVRDAEIRLEQSDRSASRDDLGVVPLLHLRGDILLWDSLFLLADIEGAGSDQGRAIDATVQLRYVFGGGWHTALGYRTLEGGADNDSVYTFAWLHYALISAGRQW